jgi:hypothetical protein
VNEGIQPGSRPRADLLVRAASHDSIAEI